MILTIDNLTGAGPIDYSAALSADQPLEVTRTLNAPSRCTAALLLSTAPTALPPPVRSARIVVTSDSGTTLFTGYIATTPVAIYAGAGLAGRIYRICFSAISDEWLLDKLSLTLTGQGFSVAGGSLLSTLANRTAPGLLTTTGVQPGNAIGVFTPEPARPWSVNAAAIASSTYAAYRALAGALSTQTIGATTHTLNFDTGAPDSGPTLAISALKTTSIKELANDVTVSGQIEPTAFVTELFQGDGATTVFQLSDPPFRATTPTLLADSFSQPALNPQLWTIADPGAHLSLGGAGLALTGGTGVDGQTTLAAIDQVELGGSLLLTAANVQLTAPSDGVLLGLYSGPINRANCFAGYNVRQSAGATLLTPFINGTEAGTSYTLLAGHAYTLRIRLHSPEVQRVLQAYYARVDGAIESFGGGLVASPVTLVFDLIDLGNASSTPAIILLDTAAAGPIPASPAACTFAAVDSLQLTGAIGSIAVTQSGPAWISSTPPSSPTYTRLIGIAGQGIDCTVSATGKVTFFAGRIPIPGELVTVSYRVRSRAVARLEDPASITAESGPARWLGKVLRPLARSSADCESAAQAILAFASDPSAAIAGSYTAINPVPDLWPGDALALTANGQTLTSVVRTVTLVNGHAVPELVTYRVTFANDWAESLGIALSEAIAPDTFLPPTAAAAPVQCLANLTALAVTSVTTTALTIDAGCAPPTGGGFEVRLRDWDFAPAPGADLVLRSPTRTLTIPRAAQSERYYIRQYDASTPPLYSRLSAAIFTNLPVA
ncbi:MAG: hypothetical protein ABSG84_13525 [Acidobacteriaceae bacterium]